MKRGMLLAVLVGLFLCQPAEAKRPTFKQARHARTVVLQWAKRTHRLYGYGRGDCETILAAKGTVDCWFLGWTEKDPDEAIASVVVVRKHHRNLQASDDWHHGWINVRRAEKRYYPRSRPLTTAD